MKKTRAKWTGLLDKVLFIVLFMFIFTVYFCIRFLVLKPTMGKVLVYIGALLLLYSLFFYLLEVYTLHIRVLKGYWTYSSIVNNKGNTKGIKFYNGVTKSKHFNPNDIFSKKILELGKDCIEDTMMYDMVFLYELNSEKKIGLVDYLFKDFSRLSKWVGVYVILNTEKLDFTGSEISSFTEDFNILSVPPDYILDISSSDLEIRKNVQKDKSYTLFIDLNSCILLKSGDKINLKYNQCKLVVNED